MPEIVFARSVHHYDSYTDFWRLVELSGFPVIRADEIDITEPKVIITTPYNGDWAEYINGEIKRQTEIGLARQAHLIVWNLERPSGSSGSIGRYATNCYDWIYGRLADEVWVSDPALADETQLRYVILGSDYGLGETGGKKQFDFTHMSMINPRRETIYSQFADYQIGPNGWGDKRHETLKASKFALNVHQDNHPFCEPLRMALFAAYGLPIISEHLRSGYPYGDFVGIHNYHGLVSAVKQALAEDYSTWQERGEGLRELLCNRLQFGKMVRQAISESVGDWR